MIEGIGVQDAAVHLLMDSAYGVNGLRAAALERNLQPVVPALSQCKLAWLLDTQRYRWRNDVERLFRRIKDYQRVFTRYDKLDGGTLSSYLWRCFLNTEIM